MNKHFNYFQSKISYQSFWLLVIGCFLILAAELSVFGLYLTYGRNAYPLERLVGDVIRTTHVVNNTPAENLPTMAKALSAPPIQITIASAPAPQSTILPPVFTIKFLKDYVLTHPHGFIISMPLKNGAWVTIRSHRFQHKWMDIGMITAMLVLFMALVLLCMVVIKRVTLPVNSLAQAVKRFGMDVNAPPLALFGPEEMQNVIQAFNNMQNKIRRLITDRTQMLAAISHDLRTPITRLQLRAEYLQGTVQYDKAIADLQEMETMISSILSFTRDYACEEEMALFDINALLQALCDDLMDMGHAVTYHSEGQRTPFLGRIAALKRAFSNIVENAIKYGEKAIVSLKQDALHIQIKVTDVGPGIPDNQMEKVFAPFYRIDTSRSLKKGGAGLGLAVARDIILAHGGKIELYNQKPKGLTVLIIHDIFTGSDIK